MNQVYVFAGFMKPGKQCYSIAFPGIDDSDGEPELQYYVHKAVIPLRMSDLSHWSKNSKTSVVIRTFSKPHSVFAAWIEDTEESCGQAIINDIQHWSCDKFVKDPDELEELCKVV